MLQQVAAVATWSGCQACAASAATAASILLHFMLSAWADGSYVQYFLQLQCLRQMVLHASRLPYSQGEKYFQNFNTAAGPNVC